MLFSHLYPPEEQYRGNSTPLAASYRREAAGAETRYLYTYEVHAKMLVVDGVAFVGSENYSWNSLTNNREIGLLVTEPNAAAAIVQQVEQDWLQGVDAP